MTESKPTIKRIEMKFQIDATLSAQVKDWAREHLGIDENCGPDSGDSYAINTLYLDSPEFDLFHKTGVVGAAKHRVRRYGNEQTLWVETKRKKRMVVSKNRTAVFESDLIARLNGLPVSQATCSDQRSREPHVANMQPPERWCGDWFLNRIIERRLQPAIQIAYRRFARTSTLNGENLRLTLDSNMMAHSIDGWHTAGEVANSRSGFQAIADVEILELKFHDRMPHLFKELLRTFAIPTSGFSKYRTAMASQLSLAPSTCGDVALVPEARGEMPASLNHA